ncbi:MAG: hypothetical protein L7U87_00395 [Chlamydiales bacterium]|nr:hypothetical protein [Chlamydiales bacterium]
MSMSMLGQPIALIIIGSVLAIFIKATFKLWIKTKAKFKTQVQIDKQQAYMELIVALQQLNEEQSETNSNRFHLAYVKVLLLGSPELVQVLSEFSAEQMDSASIQKIYNLMRKDLRIDSRPLKCEGKPTKLKQSME